MPEDGIVALDNGMYKIWFARNYRTTSPTRCCSTMRWRPWAPGCRRR
jgi:acetolactate synthase-1/2/3 large subunit